MSKSGKVIRRGTSLSLVIALIFLLSSPAAAEKTGVSLRILRNSRVWFEGELIAVKGASLLLKDESTSADTSIVLDDINTIVLKKKSGTLLGSAIGLVGGATIGYGVGSTYKNDWFNLARPIGAGIGAGVGLFAGLVIGLVVSADQEFVLSQMTPKMKVEMIEKLRSKSRLPEYKF
jgi:hypothetical protein